MRIEIAGRGFEITSAIRKAAETHLSRAAKQLTVPQGAHVVLTVEDDRHNAEIVLRSKGKTFKVVEERGDMYQALTAAAETLEKTVRKYLDRKIGRRRRSQREDKFQLAVLEPPAPRARSRGDGMARVVRSQSYEAKSLTVDEAVRELGRVRNNFIVYRNAETGRYNILYQRDDRNLGFIDLED